MLVQKYIINMSTDKMYTNIITHNILYNWYTIYYNLLYEFVS